MRPLSVIYDSQCGFCIRSLKVVKKWDTFSTIVLYDSHHRQAIREKFPMVAPEDTEEAMIAVSDDLGVFKGFYAFRRILWGVPWFWFLIPLFYLPGVPYFGTRLYAWIARNRGRFGCRAKSCDLENPPAEQTRRTAPADPKDDIR